MAQKLGISYTIKMKIRCIYYFNTLYYYANQIVIANKRLGRPTHSFPWSQVNPCSSHSSCLNRAYSLSTSSQNS